MAVIRSFNGVLYNRAKVGDLDAVVTPPYDVISPDDQEWYCGRHPNSVIRLILPGGKEGQREYAESAACLHDWLGARILVQDEGPCLYAYEQEFEVRGQTKRRLGFTCLVRLEDYESRAVRPHENIMAGPREDRLRLMRAARANFDSVFGLYANGKVRAVLEPFLSGAPEASAVDKDGVRNRLWRISDSEAISRVAQALADKSIVIADGHHRYAAALAYRDEMRAQAETADPDAPYEYVMMTLVSLEDEGLVILPTHRLVRGIPALDNTSFVSKLTDLFDVTEAPRPALLEAVEAMSSAGCVFGLYLRGGGSYVLKLKPTIRPERAIGSPGSDALKRLDVSVLHSLILEKVLGIGAQQLSAQSNVSYTRDVPGASESVDRGESQMAFLMNATRIEEVRAVAAAGDKMPQKSTFFYPKLLTGMVMRVLS